MSPVSAPASKLRLEPLSLEACLRDARWWEIYEQSFPFSQREPTEVVLESLRQGGGGAMRARRGEETVGMATYQLLRSPATVFLVYLAIAPELRGQQLGGALIDAVYADGRERLRREGLEPLGLVWEAESDEAASNPRELEMVRRRLRFFERRGGRVLACRYLQPPVDGATVWPMHLLFRPETGMALPDTATSSALVRAIYFDKYGVVNRISRALLEELLGRIGQNVAPPGRHEPNVGNANDRRSRDSKETA